MPPEMLTDEEEVLFDVRGFLGDHVQAGDGDVIRYGGPKGGPGMQEMFYPASFIKAKRLGTSAPPIGYVSPEGADAWQPAKRRRPVSAALQASTPGRTIAVPGAVRDVSQVRQG